MSGRLLAWRGSPRVTSMRLAALATVILITVAAGARAAVQPVASGTGSGAAASAVTRAADYLRRAENADGGYGGAPGQRSSPLFAGWAALGLASAGVDVVSLRRAARDPALLQYVQRSARAGDTGSLERTILALRAAGAPVDDVEGRDLGRELVRRFSRRAAVSGLVNLTAFGVLALCAAGEPATSALEARAAAWLARQPGRNGGFGFAGRGSPSDADDTGAVLEALRCIPDSTSRAIRRARRRAVAYLRHDEDRDGGFPAAPGAGSNAQSTAWAIQGLIAAGTDPSRLRRAGHTPLGYLTSLVSRSGAVAYARGQTVTPVWVTSQALLALTGTPLPFVPAG